MDKKNSNQISSPCPSAEALSIFLDEPSDAAVAVHLSSCEKCQAKLAAYDQVDRLLREQAAAPEDLSARIKTLCRQQSNAVKSKPSIQYLGAFSWLRLAAGLVVLAMVAGLTTYYTGRSGSDPERLASTPTAMPTAVNGTLDKIENTLPNEVFSLTDQMRLQGNIDGDALQNVSTGARLNTNTANRRKFRVGSQVEHIWLVNNLQQGQKVLNQLANAEDCQVTWQKEDSSDSLKAILSSSDKNIQNLVNTLKDQNWDLLSPAYPQPHAENMALLTGNLIQYQATLVKKE